MRALLSVSDKTGLVEFALGLVSKGFTLVSTGGTFATLEQAGLAVQYVSDVTGFPEILEGRVKTLHPKIHAGILAKNTPEHQVELETRGIERFDLVCVNLYPFRETIAKQVDTDTALENIDIGGPAMIRAAAKNFPNVLVVVDPSDYPSILENLEPSLENLEPSLENLEPSLETRQALARKAFAHTSSYDAAIAQYFSSQVFNAQQPLELSQIKTLRYGENPHQQAALYRYGAESGAVLDAQVLSGKEMGFNNYADADAAWALVTEFSQPACVAVKHANPCGVALADNPKTAWERARDADTLSVFGGVVALNRPVTLEVALSTKGTFLEVLIAPEITPEALEWFAAKKPDLRVLSAGKSQCSSLEYKQLTGGFLVQNRDARVWTDLCPEVVTKRQPTEQEWQDLEFAFYVGKHARSNNVVLAKHGATVGIGSGAVSRIWAAERAIANALEQAQGAVLTSEAFFPFDDVVRLAAKAGVTAILQPGGAKRDAEVIAACDELGVAMVLTGSRHFKH